MADQVHTWLSRVNRLGTIRLNTRPTWRVSTWWPGDSLRSKQRSLLKMLSVAHRQRLDHGTLVKNLAQEHRFGYRRRLTRLARRLNEGTSLVDALEQTPDVLSDEDVLTIRFATQTGTLTAAFARLVERDDAALERAHASLRQTLMYTFVMAVVLIAVVSFLVMFVVPTFQAMSADFEVRPPSTFAAFVAACAWAAAYAPLLVLMFLGGAWMAFSRPMRRFYRRVVGTRLAWGAADSRAPELLGLLALSVEGGRPIPAALSSLARYHFDSSLRQRLLFARNEIEQGSDVWESLADARLLTASESAALASSTSPQTRTWAMRRLADWKQDRVERRLESRVAFLRPTMVLVFAAVMLLVAVAMFGYLVEMINLLA